MIIKSPFDIMNQLGKPSFDEIANMDKKRHAFIVNRMLSRALPEVSFNMTHMRVTPESTVDFWNQAFKDMGSTTNGQRMLGYIRKVLRVSMAGAKKKAKSKVDKDIAKKYMMQSKMGQKEFQVLVEYYEKDLIKYLKKFSKMLETTK
jgi:3-hydroxyacyl-CoA dehydrogenase